MSLKVVIYGNAKCHWCKVAKVFFETRNIPYDYKNVANPEIAREMLKITGGRGAIPTIVIGHYFTIGANEKKLEAMLLATKSPNACGAAN